jgi:ribosomal peptide maturation radical SAM protein 1
VSPLWSCRFGRRTSPSIQLGLLKALLDQQGIPAIVHYLNLPFARLIGYPLSHILAEVRGIRLGDWLFSQAAFGQRADDTVFLNEFSSNIGDVLTASGWTEDNLLELKQVLVPEFIQACLEAIPWERYSVVGFTSTFQQNTACLALARLIKQKFPRVNVVMGGANFEGEMGVEQVRAFPWLDYAVIGEGDVVFPKLVRELLDDAPVAPRPGVALRNGGKVVFAGPAPMVSDLSKSPAPDYDEFFYTGERLQLFSEWEGARDIRLPFESSRGCWWGEKHHCTFCGLNGNTMKHRAKSAQQVLGELAKLAQRYKWNKFQAVDNIMEYPFLEDFCSAIVNEKYDLDIFYELKSNMSRDQVQKIRHAGIRRIQPGIESLSSNMLQLMKKGVRGIHNVELLKWCKYYEIYAGWNMLLGFPGERLEDCQQQADWIRSLTHLQPPDGIGQVWLERFSPFYSRPDLYPVTDVRPEKSYYYAYPAETVDLSKIAYFFDYRMGDVLERSDWQPLYDEVRKWQSRWQDKVGLPTLTYKKVFDMIFIADNRSDKSIVYPYSDCMAALYLFCESRPRQVGRHRERAWN